jgi:archaellum component FlaC
MLSISTSVVVSLVLTVVIAIAGFLFKFLFTKVVDGLKETLGDIRQCLTELTTELKDIKKTVSEVLQHNAASIVRDQRYDEEIKILRLRQHELSNEHAKVQGTLEKCKNCAKG